MTLAVMYNLLLIVGRTVFWELQTVAGGTWFALDYICDTLYILDMVVKAHECTLVCSGVCPVAVAMCCCCF